MVGSGDVHMRGVRNTHEILSRELESKREFEKPRPRWRLV